MTDFKTGAASKRQYFTFNGKSSKDFHLYLSAPGIYNAPEPDVEMVSIPGANGDLILENARTGQRRFQNVDITYKAFFFSGLPAKTQAVKDWLLSQPGYQKLEDSYDPSFFRMGICKEALEFDLTDQKAAKMEITFNCRPQRWSEDGQKEVSIAKSGSTIKNPYDFYAQPIIHVTGTAKGVLKVGNYSVTINSFTDYVDLNCETQNAYNAKGFCNDTIQSDDFPQLVPGTNKITWSGGITAVTITPRWWTL